ncbi:uncharacterized protein METZ01_LOCUS512157 [marine metagenome]|uniref:Uncharacterized protein n=1 Tax=marine metagenome TaxID=408172 RepID=A0A383ES91_9ZZZZ
MVLAKIGTEDIQGFKAGKTAARLPRVRFSRSKAYVRIASYQPGGKSEVYFRSNSSRMDETLFAFKEKLGSAV